MSTYQPHSMKIHTDAESGGAVILPDILNQNSTHNPEFSSDLVAHDNVPLFVALKSQKPVISGETFAVPTFLDNVATKGGKGILTTTQPGIVIYFKKFDDNGDAVAGSVHRSFTITGGVLVPKSMSVDHQGDLRLRWELHPLKNGSNAAVIEADNAALPTVSIASARWTLGGMTIGNITLTEYTGIEVDFGNTVQSRGSQSDVYDTHIEQRTHEPMITITGIDPTWFKAASIPLGGIAAAYATDKIYFRKRTQDGTHFVANGTATHIKITLAGLAAVDQAFRAEAQRISETTLRIKLAKDSSGNAPMTIATAIAIT